MAEKTFRLVKGLRAGSLVIVTEDNYIMYRDGAKNDPIRCRCKRRKGKVGGSGCPARLTILGDNRCIQINQHNHPSEEAELQKMADAEVLRIADTDNTPVQDFDVEPVVALFEDPVARSCSMSTASIIPELGPSSSQSSQPHNTGMKYFGNTSYVNATLQIVFALPEFSEDLASTFEMVETLPMFGIWFMRIVAARKTGSLSEISATTRHFVTSLLTLFEAQSVETRKNENELFLRLVRQFQLTVPSGPMNPVEIHFQWEMIEESHCFRCGKKRIDVRKKTAIHFLNSSPNLEGCLEAHMNQHASYLPCGYDGRIIGVKITSRFRNLPRKLILSLSRSSGNAKAIQQIVPPRQLDLTRFLDNYTYGVSGKYALMAQILRQDESTQFGRYEDGESGPNWTEIVWVADAIPSVKGDQADVYIYIQQSP